MNSHNNETNEFVIPDKLEFFKKSIYNQLELASNIKCELNGYYGLENKLGNLIYYVNYINQENL
jgi:hypothetical protein